MQQDRQSGATTNHLGDTGATATLADQIAALIAQVQAQAAQIADLRQRLGAREAPRDHDQQPAPQPARTDRRGMLRWAFGAAAATAGAGALLQAGGERAAASNGAAVILGSLNNTEEAPTQVKYDGASALTNNQPIFAVNDSPYGLTSSGFSAAISGWAGGSKGGVRSGVYGITTQTNGLGVIGSDNSNNGSNVATAVAGVGAVSAWGTGVSASGGGTGVYGTTNENGATGAGVQGNANAYSGVYGNSTSGTGVYGNSSTGTGVYGVSNGTAAGTAAISGVLTNTTAAGTTYAVFGYNKDTTANGIGVYGTHAGSGYGVRGYAVGDTSGAGYGVYGSSTNGTGVIGKTFSSLAGANVSSEPTTAGVRGLVTSTSSPFAAPDSSSGVFGENAGTGSLGFGVFGLHQDTGFGVYGKALGVGGIGVVGSAPAYTSDPISGDDYGVGVLGVGDVLATGLVGAAISFSNPNSAVAPRAGLDSHPTSATYRVMYAMTSPQAWAEDFGSGLLVHGSAHIALDPAFAHTVQTNQYHVFLTPHGNTRGLYVSATNATGFTVQEAQGGTSTVSFSYRIVAVRAGVNAPRLKAIALAPALVNAATSATARVAPAAAPTRPDTLPEISIPPTPARPASPELPPPLN